ncbi:MAG TPA: M1 family metallopeptidase [Gemmatimonadaceae bacterium]
MLNTTIRVHALQRLRRSLPLLFLALFAAAPLSVGAQSNARSDRPERAVQRDLPLPPMIRRAYAAGTRDTTGVPGRRYWQQSVDYRIDARLVTDSALLRGTETITLHNTSPDTLHAIVLRLYQNYFRAEESRNDYVTDITDGTVVERLSVNGTSIALEDQNQYRVDGTVAMVRLASPVLPNTDATIDVAWHFAVPNVPLGERGERMGRWGTDLYQIAQWYPQVAMYDDLRGWDTDQYLGKGEFYNQFGSFDVHITVPAGWLVGATGTLANPDSVLTPAVRDRLALAMQVDTTVHVVTAAERGVGQATLDGRTLTWHFTAPEVNDFAFVASRNFVYDATHAMAPKPTLVQVLYLPEHRDYQKSAQLGRFALEHHSRYVMPYEFPQATIADGPETGMEYPMIIFSGPGFGVVTHELGHEWFPMTVSSDETRYGWQDEGFNEWIDQAAAEDFTKKPTDHVNDGAAYRHIAGTVLDPTLMWPSDFAGPNYEIQAYVKAPLALYALGGVVGDSAVHAAFADYAKAWRFKHPSPWDFFTFMQHHIGQDLGWFWNAWWFTTDTFDQGIDKVSDRSGRVTFTVVDHGEMPMPIIARIDYTDGTSTTITRPASVWFSGSRSVTVEQATGKKHIASITLDPDNRFQDLNRADNEWKGETAEGR